MLRRLYKFRNGLPGRCAGLLCRKCGVRAVSRCERNVEIACFVMPRQMEGGRKTDTVTGSLREGRVRNIARRVYVSVCFHAWRQSL